MSEEGDFLYYYVVCCFWFFFVVLVAACCVGSCIFTTGSLISLSMVENALKELNSMSGDPQRNPSSDSYARANNDPEATTTAQDTFREEFKEGQ